MNRIDVNLAMNLTVDTGNINNLTVDGIVGAVVSTINGTYVTPADVYIIELNQTIVSGTSRRSTTTTVSVNYIIRVDSNNVASVTNATGSTAQIAASLAGSGVTVDSLTTVSVLSAAASSTSSSSSLSGSTYYIVVTPLFVLPQGAYLTSSQQTALISEFISAYSLPFSTIVTITTVGNLVQAQYSVLGVPSNTQLQSQVLFVTYTNADGSSSTSPSLTSTSQASQSNGIVPTSTAGSSGSGTIIGAAVGGAVGAALLALLIIAVVIRRQRSHVRPS